MAQNRIHPNKRSGRSRVSDFNRRSTTRDLTRMLTVFREMDRWIIKKEIKEFTGLADYDKMSDGLNWLVCYGIIEKKLIVKTLKNTSSVRGYRLTKRGALMVRKDE